LISDCQSRVLGKGRARQNRTQKWQGFDHINGAKMGFLARIMVINNRFTVMTMTVKSAEKRRKKRSVRSKIIYFGSVNCTDNFCLYKVRCQNMRFGLVLGVW